MNLTTNLNAKSKEELIEELNGLKSRVNSLEAVYDKLKIELTEREKERQVFFKISSLMEHPNISLDEIFHEILDIIPSSWQYPEVTCARIIFGNNQYETKKFIVSKWKQSEDIVINKQVVGQVEVYCTEQKTEGFDGPYSNAEQRLLKVIAEMFGKIIQRKQTTEKLVQSEELNRLLVETIPFGMDIISESGEILFANEMMKKEFGSDITGRKCWETYRTDGEQCSFCPLKHELKTGTTENCESSGIIGNKIFEISHTGFIYQGQKAILEIYQDITQRKEIERKNRHIKRRLQGIFDSMLDAYFQIDLSGKISFLNRAALTMYGYSSYDEVLGKPVSILYADEADREKILSNLRKTKKTSDLTAKGSRKDGTSFWISISGQFIYDEQGNIAGTQGVVRDISERIEAGKAKTELLNRFKLIGEHIPGMIFQYQCFDG